MGRKKTQKSVRSKLLSALFAKGARAGLDADYIREELAPSVIGKRLSRATTQEIFSVVEHLAKLHEEKPYYFGYDSSIEGLLAELEDAARARWGEDFKRPLNRFVNSHRTPPTHYRFLEVDELKIFRDRIKELNREDGKAEYAET